MGDWEPVDLEGAEIHGVERGHYSSVVAYGQRAGGPFAAVLDPDRGTQVLELPGQGPVSWVAVSEAIELVVEDASPVHVVGGGVLGLPFTISHDIDLADAVRLWPVCGDEDQQVVVLERSGRLRVVDVSGGDPPQGDGLWLVSDEPASAPLQVGQGQVVAYVAGHLRGGSDEAGEQLWLCDPYQGWQQVQVDPPPDRFTDIFSGASPTFAGHRHGLPLLFDESGSPLDTPAVPLDPDDPQVCVASVGRHVTLALQSAEAGPQLWLGEAGSWAIEPLPPGSLRAARCTGGAHAWVVIDGRVWHGTGLWSSGGG